MSRQSTAASMLPAPVARSLGELGQNLRIARKRRKETLASFAERMQVSIPTLRNMDRGDPTVSIAIYAMALWFIGRLAFLSEIADPFNDETALLLELRRLEPKVNGSAR
ncbi:helix-turn-helix domain-containing protein [Mycoavidus sp. HKI]|uniref:helix-turn-helix domain-containing protein n=1 Tax=Mycoavidus sp. HKI TaxID=2840467 RepID=UPI001CBA79F6|nr:helix-turn-helix transcriptional regulator [Mycoavidus sp. HKI]UAW64953.2 helix-turn-helix domain-containing protein [Mycoavidus sp. HKI]